MKILGINISHDPSVAGIVDGEVKFVYDEARFRRDKYWSPEPKNFSVYECIEHKIDSEEWDAVIFATFDRRNMNFAVDKDTLVWNRAAAKDILEDLSTEQLTHSFMNDLQGKYGKDNLNWGVSNLTADTSIINEIMQNHLSDKKGKE